MKRLILTADDFGYDRRINAAVLKAYKEGVLRHASLMVDREGAAEAAEIARKNPGLGVGLHLELCRSQPALWGLRYFFLPAFRRKIEPEIRRQIERFLSLGLAPSHVDGHFNIHVHPAIFPVLARLCREYRIPRTRLPRGEMPLCGRYQPSSWLAIGPLAVVFSLLGAYLRLREGKGLVIPERTFGLLRSGLMKEDYLVFLLRNLPEGLTEIYFHPTTDPESEVDSAPTTTHHTLSELKALLSPRVREALRSAEARLLEEGSPPSRDPGTEAGPSTPTGFPGSA